MMVDTEDLVCGADIADMLGVTRAAVCNWAARETSGFPAPLVTVGAGPLYSRRAVLKWAADREKARAERYALRAHDLRQQAIYAAGRARHYRDVAQNYFASTAE